MRWSHRFRFTGLGHVRYFSWVRRVVLLLAVSGALAGCASADTRPAGESSPDSQEHRVSAPPAGPASGAPKELPDLPRLSAPYLDVQARELPERAAPPKLKACEIGQEQRMRSPTTAYAAIVKRRAIAYSRPGGQRLRTFGRLNVNDFPTVFGVLAAILDERCKPVWYRVQLPMRPNGIVGFVRAADVSLASVRIRIAVDLSERRIDVFRDGRRIARMTAAIGASITPTPLGDYYVNQKLVAPDPWGPFGPAALGISAFSPVLQDWVQGGPIAIHGTNQPASVGDAVSHGCLRVRNEELLWLFDHAPAGTPVRIRA